MNIRFRNLAVREILPTAWACSSFHIAVHRALPLLGAASVSLLTPFPFMTPALAQSEGATASSSPQPTSTTRPQPCASADHRAFDFWIGTWAVTGAGKKLPTATNIITRAHGGCVIEEHYKTKGGYTGMSISFYDAQRKIWHQTWMGKDGGALFTEGGLNSKGEMVLSNQNWPGYVKGSPINRITWTPNADGSVRQHWQSSTDDGTTWSDVFDGHYVKKSPKSAD